MSIGMIGLGEVGSNIAKTLIRKGQELTVFNRTSNKAKNFAKKHNCEFAPTIESLCKDNKIIIISVNDPSTEKQIDKLTDQIIQYAKPNSIVIDNSMIDVQKSKTIYKKCKKNKINYLDAPVSGCNLGAKNQIGSIMVGGDKKVFNKVKNIIMKYTKALEYMGPSGEGQLAKVAVQICASNTKQALFESLDFAYQFKINTKKLTNLMLHGAANSSQVYKNLVYRKLKKIQRPRTGKCNVKLLKKHKKWLLWQ